MLQQHARCCVDLDRSSRRVHSGALYIRWLQEIELPDGYVYKVHYTLNETMPLVGATKYIVRVSRVASIVAA